MKRFVYLLIVVFVSCQPVKKNDSKIVTVSIIPQKYFVDKITENSIEVNVLVPAGSSPHNYEVLPSQMKDLSNSKIWLQIGLMTFEQVWKDKISNINKDLLIINCSNGIEPIFGSECEHEGHDHSGHAHGEIFDPHIWLAPAESKIMAENTYKALAESFPEDKIVFEKNYLKLISEIDSLSIFIDKELATLKSRKFLIFHPALGYFARQFNLEQLPLELDGKEPSPKHMKSLVDIANLNNIKVVFIQKEFDTENALQLSREIGGSIEVIDPLDYNWLEQMKNITAKISLQK